MKHRSLLIVTVVAMSVTPADAPSQAQPAEIGVSASVSPLALEEPGGTVTYSVRITNTLPGLGISITSVEDKRIGDLDDEGGIGCFDAPMNMAPGDFASCRYTAEITGAGGTAYSNLIVASGYDESGRPVLGSAEPRVELLPRLIDLVVVKDATSPTPLNGVVVYTLTVTNKGPNTAVDVHVADPAPAGIAYLRASPAQGTCSVSPSFVTCALGSLAARQSLTTEIAARATEVGLHTNTATVTGGGGRETSPADNVDDAVTVVPQPLLPPAPPPCLQLTVAPRQLRADGKTDRITVKVTAAGRRVAGVRVLVRGAGVRKTRRTDRAGIAVLVVNPGKAGLLTVSARDARRRACGVKLIGVVGVFLPPPAS